MTDPTLADAFFQRAATGAVVINRLRRVLGLNPSAAQMTGWSPRDLGQATCRSWACRDERGKPLCGDNCLAQRCVESGAQVGPMYLKITSADGRAVACEATFVPLRPDDTRGGTCLVVMQDVSLLEGLDKAVRERDQQIAESRMAMRAMGQHAGAAFRTAWAEMRTSLGALRGQAAKMEPERAKLVERAHNASGQVDAFFMELLSRLRSSSPPGGRT